jgi:hypothetical protein
MMKMTRLIALLAVIHFGIQIVSIRGQDGADVQAVNQEPLRWNRYSYAINSSYPYLKDLPAWSKIPLLLDWMSREAQDAGIEVAYSQLVALSRVDFGHPQHPPAGGLPAETVSYHRNQRSNAWARWWKSVGQPYGEKLHAQGRQNPKAWKLVVRDDSLPGPDYRITIPDEWVLRTSYRAGDYDAIQTESVTLRRSKEKATLIRGLRKRTGGRLEWEEWRPLNVEQADDFAFALAYAIDNPWLLKPKGSEGRLRELEGRSLSLYYPSFRYDFADLQGNIWWNDDPWNWHGGNVTDRNFMDTAGTLGSVCLLVWRAFPESLPATAAMPNVGSWRSVKSLDAVVLGQLEEDLALRGEIIDTLWHVGRVSDALEALAEFGTPEQLPALSRFEAELPLRLDQVKSLLAQDPNGKHLKAAAERWLTGAAKTKAAVEKRRDGQK